MVQISISGRLAGCVALEDRLKRKFGLQDVVVVPTPRDQKLLPQIIGTAAGQYLGSRLKDGLSIGVGWGRTLRFSLSSMPRRNYKNLSVVSLMGGLTQSSLDQSARDGFASCRRSRRALLLHRRPGADRQRGHARHHDEPAHAARCVRAGPQG